MIPRNQVGDVFADIEKCNVYLIESRLIPLGNALATRMDENRQAIHLGLVQYLQKVVMAATEGGNGMEATLMTSNQLLGHPSFKMVVAFARSGASGIVISNILCMRRMSSSQIGTPPALKLVSSGSVKWRKLIIVSTNSLVLSSRSYPWQVQPIVSWIHARSPHAVRPKNPPPSNGVL